MNHSLLQNKVFWIRIILTRRRWIITEKELFSLKRYILYLIFQKKKMNINCLGFFFFFSYCFQRRKVCPNSIRRTCFQSNKAILLSLWDHMYSSRRSFSCLFAINVNEEPHSKTLINNFTWKTLYKKTHKLIYDTARQSML